MIFVNFKTYEKGTGANALSLVRVLETVSESSGVRIIPVLQAADIKEASLVTRLPIWGQGVDPVDYGAHTGSVLPEALKEDGAEGTFLNHSEHKFEEFADLREACKRAHGVGLKTLVFAGGIKELEEVVKLKPDYVSYEPPELVGSKTTSVAESRPDVITKAVEMAVRHGLPLVVGAGIKSSKDVKVSLALGAVGVAVASAVVGSGDPEAKLMELTKGYE
jgi:triosephosphate isomerase